MPETTEVLQNVMIVTDGEVINTKLVSEYSYE